MKKNNTLKKKLTFNKETVANLNGPAMNRLVGGVLATTVPCASDCYTIHHPICMNQGTDAPTCPASCLPPCESGEPGCPPVETEQDTCPIGCTIVV